MSDGLSWATEWRLEKFRGDSPVPYEVIEDAGNLLVYGGGSAVWDLLIAAGNVTEFDNTNAHIGVGDSSTAAAATQTDLQAASNKFYEPMDATYPLHTDGTGTSANAQVTFKSTFETADANFAWQEWGIFNALSSGRMLNRKVQSLGTKTNSDTWSLTITITLS